MNQNLIEQFEVLPAYFQGHLALVLTALLVGIAVSVPLGLLAFQITRLRKPLLTVVSIIQTFPSIAILALVVAMLGGQIGFLPAIIALTLYSMLPIVRNTVAGLDTIQPQIIEAATGIGLSSTQVMFKVRLPLALPVIIAGIRTAAVWTVGLATLSTLVGATSFGNYIFTGLQTRNLTAVVFGSVAAAAMAVVLDSIIGGIQWLVENRHSARANSFQFRAVAAAVAGGLLLGCALSVYSLLPKPQADFVVGGKGFTEQYIWAGLLTAELEQAGFSVDQRLGLGTEVVYEATANGAVDVYLEYTGTVWATRMEESGNPGQRLVRQRVTEFVNADGLYAVGPAGFQNLYAFAMRKDRAAELGVRTIEDLIPVASELTAGGDLEFFGRPEWVTVRDSYGFDFGEKLTFDTALMYTAVNDRQVDVISAYSSDGRVAAFDLLILEDPREALLPYDGLLLASAEAASNPRFRAVVEKLVNGVDDVAMREANRLVDVEGKAIGEAVAYLQSRLNRAD